MTLICSVNAQNYISATGGLSFHGSGDLPGYNFGCGYGKRVSKRTQMNFFIRNTTGSSEIPLVFDAPGVRGWNSSIRYVTSGVQMETSFRYSIVKTKGFSLFLDGGMILRHQVSNYYSDLLILYPGLTGYPTPLISFYARDEGKYRRNSIGYLAIVGTSFNISKNSVLQFSINLQNDNNGDLVWNLPITISRKLHKKQ